jgi:hypothetical protein
MNGRILRRRQWRRSTGRPDSGRKPSLGQGVGGAPPPRSRASMVLCGLVVLGLILGTATATRAMGRPRQHDPVVTTGAPAAAPAPSPITVQFDTYTASITNGATQNDLYIWLAGRAGKVVHVILSVSRPVAVSLTVRPRTLTMASNCRTPNPPGNCDNILGMLGTR